MVDRWLVEDPEVDLDLAKTSNVRNIYKKRNIWIEKNIFQFEID